MADFTYVTGTGTQADPYIISNAYGWNEIAYYLSRGFDMQGEYLELACDFDGSTNGDETLNTSYSTFKAPSIDVTSGISYFGGTFKGTFDGKNHTIKNYEGINRGIIHVSNNAIIKNLNVINIYTYDKYVFEIEPIFGQTNSINFENILITYKSPIAFNSGYSPICINFSNISGSEINGNINFNKCVFMDVTLHNFHEGIALYFYSSLGKTITGLRTNIDNCLFFNSFVYYINWTVTYNECHLNNTLFYRLYTSDIDSIYNNTFKSVTNCYIAHKDNQPNIISSFTNPNFKHISLEDCLDENTFDNFDFNNIWQIDEKLNCPIPKSKVNQYIYIFHDAFHLNINYYKTFNESTSYELYFKGNYGLIKRGSNVSFGVYVNNNFILDILDITNNDGESVENDYKTYQNIQDNIIRSYLVRPNFTDKNGDGSENNPYIIKNYHDLFVTFYINRSTCQYFTDKYYVRNDNTNPVYYNITNDIICNDVSNYNNWINTLPQNFINSNNNNLHILSYGTHGNYIGNNHSIVGLCGKTYDVNTFYVTKNACFNNVKFDYIFAIIDGNITFNNCELNGRYRLSSHGSSNCNIICNTCLLNILPSFKNTKDDYMFMYNAGDRSIKLTMNNCLINCNVSTLTYNQRQLIANNCIFVGKVYKIYYSKIDFEYGTHADSIFTNCYILKNTLIKKHNYTISGLQIIDDNQAMIQSNYNLDFVNTWEIGSKYPILKNLHSRFNLFSAVNEYLNGLNSISNYFYICEKTNPVSLTLNIVESNNFKFVKWSDDVNIKNRTILLNDDYVLTYTLLPDISLNGTGTEEDPYLINNKQDLLTFNNFYSVNNTANYNPCYVKLMNDIEFQDTTNWTSWDEGIADETWNAMFFDGFFDGNNHTISGLYRQTNAYRDYALFINMISSGMMYGIRYIKNLTIDKSVIKNGNNRNTAVGIASFIEINDFYADKCVFKGHVIGNVYSSLWISGLFYAEILSSDKYHIDINECQFYGLIKINGIVEYSQECYFSGIVLIYNNNVLYMSQNYYSNIKKCKSDGIIDLSNLTSESTSVYYANRRNLAGIACLNSYTYLNITECYNKTNITSNAHMNICGILFNRYDYTDNLNVLNCYNIGNLSSRSGTIAVSGIARYCNTCLAYNYGMLNNQAYPENVYGTVVNANTNTSYFLKGTAPASSPGTELTAAEFALSTSFAGFDFINTWEMDYSNGRPKLINNFEPSVYNLVVTSSNPNYGITTGSGEYEYGTIVQITALPYSGCTFEAWSDGNRENPRYVLIERAVMYQAIFKGGYPIRLLDYYGLIQLWTNIKTYLTNKFALKVDKTEAGNNSIPVYFNNNGVPTPCTSVNLNSATTTRLQSAVKISGVNFDGSQDITLTKTNIGLENVDNTSDVDKPVSNATNMALTTLETNIKTYDTTYQFIDNLPEVGNLNNSIINDELKKIEYSNITYSMIDDIIK